MKETMTMPGHVVKTVAELTEEIGTRQTEIANLMTTRATLLELYGGFESPTGLAGTAWGMPLYPLAGATKAESLVNESATKSRKGKSPIALVADRVIQDMEKNPRIENAAKKRASKRSEAVAAVAPAAVTGEAKTGALGGRLAKWAGPADEKPDSVGAAMKWIGKQLAPVFTRDMMRDSLLADKDWAKLHEACPQTFAGNLCYWVKSGKLKRTGEKDGESFEVVNLDF